MSTSMELTGLGSEWVEELRSRFQLGPVLGRGTYAKVRLGKDRRSGRKVALKCFRKSQLRSETAVDRVRCEVEAMRRLQHPNIVQLLQVIETRDRLVLVQEFAAGGELYERVQNQRLTECEAQRLFGQLVEAVRHCHQRGIVHRDLKLENILLDEQLNIKLADFGLACPFSASSQLTGFCGSALYASPEVLSRTPYTGPELDCWSLGVVLYTLLHGSMPFGGEPVELRRRVVGACYKQPRHVPGASDVIKRLLQPEVKQRATTQALSECSWLQQARPSRTADDECLGLSESEAQASSYSSLDMRNEQAEDDVFEVATDELPLSNTKDSGLGLDELSPLSVSSRGSMSDSEARPSSSQLLDVSFGRCDKKSRPRSWSLSTQAVDV